ncbi:hypothetical protein LTR16_007443, partial [Cryomyces antarcticus]
YELSQHQRQLRRAASGGGKATGASCQEHLAPNSDWVSGRSRNPVLCEGDGAQAKVLPGKSTS